MDTKPTYEELEKTIKELERRQDKQTEKEASYGQDLPQRKQAEEALRESEAKYLQLFNTVPAAIILYDAETKKMIDGNDAAFDLYGYSREEFLNLTYWDITAEPEKSKETIPRVLSGEVKRIPLRYQKKKDGTVIPVEASVGVFRLNNRKVICGVSTDISEYLQAQKDLEKINQELRDEIQDREQAENLLRESEEKYRLLVKNANDAIFIAQDDAVKFPNPKGEEMTGYSAEELAKMPFINLIHPDDRNMVLDRNRRRLSGEKLPETYEFRIINKAGEKLWVELNTVVINWEERPATLNLLREITQQKKLEAQLIDTRKMEAISTLAGGIAHEFNNALTGVVGNIQLLEMSLPDNKTVTKHTMAMKVSSQRMVNLTSQLLAYARGGRYQAKTMSLSDFVEDTLPIIKPNIDPSIRLETDLPRDVFSVKADPAQMQMVLSAVVSNSTEAIEGDGRIRITASNKEIDAAFVKSHPELNPGRYVCLSIVDDGKGMDEETLNKIFDPFYTTKFMGRGLGMAAVYGIIKNHDGWISIDSEQGKGTVVRIYLPGFDDEEKEVLGKPSEEAMVISGTGTILVIEDEETVMIVIRDILDKLGYRMLEAKTGKEAIEFAKTFDGDIDLALLDIKLPDIWGDKLYPQIMEARPDLKVIVCSGYSIDGPAQTILDAGAQDFIQKPFTVETLSVKLKKVLESD